MYELALRLGDQRVVFRLKRSAMSAAELLWVFNTLGKKKKVERTTREEWIRTCGHKEKGRPKEKYRS